MNSIPKEELERIEKEAKEKSASVDFAIGYIAGATSECLRNASRWVSVKERLPEIGRFVLAAELAHNIHTVNILWWLGEQWADPDNGDHNINVTHWQPLPEPLQEKRA